MVCKLLQSFVLHSDGQGNRDGINFPVCNKSRGEPRLWLWGQAAAGTEGYGEQRFPESDNLDAIRGNFHRHPDHQDKFKIPSLSITSHNHSSILPQSSSHAYPAHHFLFAFFLPLFRQRPLSHKTFRTVTYCHMRQNTKKLGKQGASGSIKERVWLGKNWFMILLIWCTLFSSSPFPVRVLLPFKI